MKPFLKSLFGSSAKRPARQARACKPQFESLEDRVVPANFFLGSSFAASYAAGANFSNNLTVSLQNGRYVLNDTAETISVGASSPFLRSLISGNGTHTVSVPASVVSSLSIALGNFNDTVTVNSSVVPVLIRMGTGNDTALIGSATTGMAGIRNVVNVNGEGQNFARQDVLSIRDTASAVADRTYTVAAGSITRTGAGPVVYSNMEAVVVNAGRGNDLINVVSSTPNTTVDAGQGNDIIRLGNQGSVQSLTGLRVLGGAGRDWLDYSAFSQAVSVNMAAGTATGAARGIAQIENALGGSGADVLTGDNANNILVGGDGADVLTGNGFSTSTVLDRDILIGGLGQDTLLGGRGEDILVGGTTVHDLSPRALQAIMTEWESGSTYQDRVRHIVGDLAGGLNGQVFLNNDTVTADDDSRDDLRGQQDRDWFWSDDDDTDRNDNGDSGEERNEP